jgi:RNA polymerase sigma factor (sigma-70 family)
MAPKRNSMQDDTFLEKAIRGDKDGIEYLVKTYQNLAYTIAVKIVLNKEDAEEVVQDSFMKAFASLSKFRMASKFSTWLYRIVYNTAITRITSKKIETIALNDPFENGQYLTTDNREWNLLIQDERKKYIDLALEQLSQDDRLIITLYYIGEKDISEICEIMGIGKSAIKMRLLRGRKQLECELRLLLSNELKDLL